MTNPHATAFPLASNALPESAEGLSKREFFAVVALHSMIASMEGSAPPSTRHADVANGVGEIAVLFADGLIKALQDDPA